MNYLRRGRESREEEGGRLGPLGSAGLGGFHISIFATSRIDFFKLLDGRTVWITGLECFKASFLLVSGDTR